MILKSELYKYWEYPMSMYKINAKSVSLDTLIRMRKEYQLGYPFCLSSEDSEELASEIILKYFGKL